MYARVQCQLWFKSDTCRIRGASRCCPRQKQKRGTGISQTLIIDTQLTPCWVTPARLCDFYDKRNALRMIQRFPSGRRCHSGCQFRFGTDTRENDDSLENTEIVRFVRILVTGGPLHFAKAEEKRMRNALRIFRGERAGCAAAWPLTHSRARVGYKTR
jgi:hypothetical protein